jgi:hypothetical protein
VRTTAQFLLVDDNPKQGAAPGSRLYWSTFQTGLLTASGVLKPAFTAYRIPIWVPSRSTVWGQLRPAPRGSVQVARIEVRPRGGSAFATVATVRTANVEGYLLAHVRLPAHGSARIAWTDPETGATEHSRAAAVP